MEEMLAALRRITLADRNFPNQDINTSSKCASPRKTLKHRYSVFSFSGELLKSNKTEEEAGPPCKQDCKDNAKPSWNSFLSLRGLRGIKKPEKSSISNGENSPPRKSSTSARAEFGPQKAARRKSLQDLIGTVGGKLSRRHHHNSRGSGLPWREDLFPSQDSNDGQNISPLVSPDSAVRCPPRFDEVFGNLSILARDCGDVEAEHDRPRIILQHGQGRSYCSQAGGPLELQPRRNNNDGNHANVFGSKQKLCSFSYTRDTLETSQLSGSCEISGALEMQKESQDFRRPSRPQFPDMLRPSISIELLQNINPALPLHVKFLELKEPSQYRHSEKFKASENLLQIVKLEASFPGTVVNREKRCNSICHESQGNSGSPSNAHIENFVSLTEKMSGDSQLCIRRRTWPVNSFETSRDNGTRGDVEPNGKEFCELVEKDQKILNEEKMVSRQSLSLCNPFHDYPQRHSCDWMDDSLEKRAAMRTWESDFDIGTADVIRSAVPRSYEMSLASKTPMIPLETGGRFRPRRVQRRSTLTEIEHPGYVQDEFNLIHTETDILKNSVRNDIHHDNQQCSGQCECSLDVGHIHLQLKGRVCGLVEYLRISPEGKEMPWPQMQSTPQGLSPSEQIAAGKGECDAFTEYVLNIGNTSSSQNALVLVSDSDQNTAATSPDTPRLSQHVTLAVVPGFWFGGQIHHRNQTTSGEVALSTQEGTSGKGDCKESRQLVYERPRCEKKCPDFTDLRHRSDDLGEISGSAIGSATARRYIGSFSSSSDSLQCYQLPSPESPVPVDIFVSKLEDAQLEEAEPVKTWPELGREFLDKYAPGSEISRAERGRVAVREVLQRRQITRSGSNESETSVGETFKTPSQRSLDHRCDWRRDRESSGDVKFDNVWEIVEYECAREERLRAKNLPQSQIEQFQDTDCDPSDPVDLNTKVKERIELGQEFYSSSIESELTCEQLFQKSTEPPAESAATPSGYGWRDWIGERPVGPLEVDEGNNVGTLSVYSPAYPSTSSGSEDDGLESHQGRNTNGKIQKLRKESIKSGDTEMTTATEFKFTQCAEQLEDILIETLGERTVLGESRGCHQTHTAGELSETSSDISASTNRVTPDNYVACSLYGSVSAIKFANTSTAKPRHEELCEGKTKHREYVLRDNISSEASRDCVSAEEKTFIIWNDKPAHVAELSRSATTSPLSAKQGLVKCSGEDFMIAGPHSEQKRTWTLNHSAISPLLELKCHNALVKYSPAAPPSETDTEMSETFGHKLERYGHFTEDGSPNDTSWYTIFPFPG